MASPTFVSYTDTGWSTGQVNGTVATGTISVASGDILVAVGAASDSAITLAVSGGSLIWTTQQSNTTASNCSAYLWTTTATSTTSFAVTFTRTGGSGSMLYGGGVFVFRSAAIGASNKAVTTGAPSCSLTTQAANSAIVAVNADWAAADGTSRTWRTINSITPTSGNGGEKAYFRNSIQYTMYTGYWSDAGSAAAKTAGLSAPTGQTYSLLVLEVKGTASLVIPPFPGMPLSILAM